MKELLFNDKKIYVQYGKSIHAPILYINTLEVQEDLYEMLQKEGLDVSLVYICGMDWNRDMTPWPALPLYKQQAEFGGQASSYLQWMIQYVIPQAEKDVPIWRGLVGYSLAGLFALYSMYQTDLFSRVASISGSLWYPGFKTFVYEHSLKAQLDRLYLSLGDKEKKTRNPVMKTVEENTMDLYSYYQESGICTIFEINPGNHFQDVFQRVYKGAHWLLKS